MNEHDPRWGDHVPWFFRGYVLGQGNFRVFLERLSHRVERLILYNEAGIANLNHFGAILETETFQRFRHVKLTPSLAEQLRSFFSPKTIDDEAARLLYWDPEAVAVASIEKQQSQHISKATRSAGGYTVHGPRNADLDKDLMTAKIKESITRNQRVDRHFRGLTWQRFGVLESLLRILPRNNGAANAFERDIRRFLAEAQIMMDRKGDPPLLVPTEEPLMQREVIERLLPTLHLRFPERAQDLISGYHDLLGGKDTNTVFGNTFKGLEELARQLTGNDKLMLNKPEEVQKHFPQLHPTIIKTIANIANHRGDEAGHGRKGPDQVEMRYLLFQICNIALLMLEYYPPTSKLYSLDS